MKTCILLAMSFFFLLVMGCRSGIFDFTSQSQAWPISNESIVTIYDCRMLPPDNSWDTDVPPLPPYPDKTRYIASIFNGQAGHLPSHLSSGWDYKIPARTAGIQQERPLITLVMRDEKNRAKS